MNRRAVTVAVITISALLGLMNAAYARRDRSDERLPDWVRIAGQTYGGQSADEVRTNLRERMSALLSRQVVLVAAPPEGRRRMWTVTRRALGETIDVDGMAAAAFAAARGESLWGRITRHIVQRDPVEIPIRRSVDAGILRQYLARNVRDTMTVESRSARLTLRAGKPVILPEKAGLMLEMEASVAAVTEFLLADAAERVDLILKTVVPEVSAADARGIVSEIAHFETSYREKGNRRMNLELACAKINGTIIKPGGVFSYNAVVGPRVAEAGFRMAPVIVRGRMEPGMGGGICQVSSTLYNAALLADLGVVRRQHHAFPVHYLPAGRDATVVYGAIDLKLKNTSDTAVGIIADGSNGKVKVRFFGTPKPGRTISIERTAVSSWAAPVQTVSDPTLPAGKTVVRDSGRAGHRVTVWRVVRENGRVVRREMISRDVYRAFPRVIARGTGPSATPPATPGSSTGAAAVPAVP